METNINICQSLMSKNTVLSKIKIVTGDACWVRCGLYQLESNKYKQCMDPEWLEQIPR